MQNIHIFWIFCKRWVEPSHVSSKPPPSAIKVYSGAEIHIDDILITLGKQFHLIHHMADTLTVFLYVALDKKIANLGIARVQVKKLEQSLSL